MLVGGQGMGQVSDGVLQVDYRLQPVGPGAVFVQEGRDSDDLASFPADFHRDDFADAQPGIPQGA